MNKHFDYIIVGAGISGLSCALSLASQGRTFRIFEASDSVGGRARTDEQDGFLLDRGFQVFLTAYPEARRLLDYQALEFRKFKSGALIRHSGQFCRVSDVVKHPADLPGNLFSKAATLLDKLKINSLRKQLATLSIEEIANSENKTSYQRLQEFGFSEKVINSFFRPFFGGVFLEKELATSRRMLDFVFKMFAEGEAVIPSRGMGEIARQMASKLPDGTIQFNCPVRDVSTNRIVCGNGDEYSAGKVIVATDQNSAFQFNSKIENQNNGVTCLYFSAPVSPVKEPILVLNGDGKGPINNLCVPSDVAPSYAPNGKSLISISVIEKEKASDLVSRVLQQAVDWYGNQVDSWEHIRTYEIPFALPNQSAQRLDPVAKAPTNSDKIFYCGDYQNFASIQGAMESGRKTAEHLAS